MNWELSSYYGGLLKIAISVPSRNILPNFVFLDLKSNIKNIKSALISVYYKDNLEPIIKKLHSLNVKLYSTGGTLTFFASFKRVDKSVDVNVGEYVGTIL